VNLFDRRAHLREPSDHSELSPRKPPLGSKCIYPTVAPFNPLQGTSHSEWSRSVAASLLRLRNVAPHGGRTEVPRLHAPQTCPLDGGSPTVALGEAPSKPRRVISKRE
jgi:hypothetical protein